VIKIGNSSADSQAFSTLEVKKDIERGTEKMHGHTGLLDPIKDEDRIDLLNYLAVEWHRIRKYNKDLPVKFKDSKVYRTVLKNRTTKYVSKGIKEGDIGVLKRISGRKVKDTDLSGLKTLKKLKDRFRSDIYIAYLAGQMGKGKTDFALLMSEIFKEECNGLIGSNIRSFKEKDRLVESFEELEGWLEDGTYKGRPKQLKGLPIVDAWVQKRIQRKGRKKLFIFDEASSHASGYDKDSGKVERQFSELLKKFRKYDASLIIIGHTGKDVHPDIRRLVDDYIVKKGKKRAVFYDSVAEGRGRGKKLSVSGIPKTNFSYDTKEVTEWRWKDEDEGRDGEDDEDPLEKRVNRAEEVAEDILKNNLDDYLERYKSSSKDGIKRIKREKIQRRYKIDDKTIAMVKDILRDELRI